MENIPKFLVFFFLVLFLRNRKQSKIIQFDRETCELFDVHQLKVLRGEKKTEWKNANQTQRERENEISGEQNIPR